MYWAFFNFSTKNAWKNFLHPITSNLHPITFKNSKNMFEKISSGKYFLKIYSGNFAGKYFSKYILFFEFEIQFWNTPFSKWVFVEIKLLNRVSWNCFSSRIPHSKTKFLRKILHFQIANTNEIGKIHHKSFNTSYIP